MTRDLVSQVLAHPKDYVIMPEPAGVRCIVFIVNGMVRLFMITGEIVGLPRFEIQLAFTLLEGYRMDDRSLVLTDIRIFEKEDVGHLPFGLRMNLLMKSLLPRAPSGLRIRPFFRMKHAAAILQKKTFQFPICGFAITALNDPFEYIRPATFVCEFSCANPVVVIFVDFEAHTVTGHILGPTALIPVATIEDIRGSLYAVNGKLAEIEITGSAENEHAGFMKARFVRPALVPQPWTKEQLELAFPDLQPAVTVGQLSGLL
jgi:hypothetical protein